MYNDQNPKFKLKKTNIDSFDCEIKVNLCEYSVFNQLTIYLILCGLFLWNK